GVVPAGGGGRGGGGGGGGVGCAGLRPAGPAAALDPAEALACARRLERAVAEPVRVEAYDARVTASTGVAPVPAGAGAAAVPAVLRAADEAMYRAKRAGGGPVLAQAPAGG
ncbi:diguanylate cyclase domain-containing protein, partial [Kineococcus sp. SYSU DK005]|uniref:diguanylate cyclase domain-containing protein n=1 Tax=Kineococcus sp. SYSU DK005 TaxID=3383126 RepID=UPI003D7DA4CD